MCCICVHNAISSYLFLILQTRRGIYDLPRKKSWQSTYTLTYITPLSEIEEEDEKNLTRWAFAWPRNSNSTQPEKKNKFFRRKNFLADFNSYNIYCKTTAVINNFSHFFSLSCFFLNVHLKSDPITSFKCFLPTLTAL